MKESSVRSLSKTKKESSVMLSRNDNLKYITTAKVTISAREKYKMFGVSKL